MQAGTGKQRVTLSLPQKFDTQGREKDCLLFTLKCGDEEASLLLNTEFVKKGGEFELISQGITKARMTVDYQIRANDKNYYNQYTF